MYLLYRQVGLSCLVGVAIAVVMIPLNKYVADKIGAMSTKMMSAKDERVKLMSEVLHGVRSIKFFAWEEYFLGRVGRDFVLTSDIMLEKFFHVLLLYTLRAHVVSV